MKRGRIFLALLLLLGGCTAASPNFLRGELANDGPLPLSRDNPFLAPNLFVALERDASPLVAKFINHRGEPDAVEIRRNWFQPLKIYFFYFDKREAYLFEQRESSWIILGPERIPDQIFNQHFLAVARGGPPALAERKQRAPETELAVDSYLNDPTEPAFDTPAAPSAPPLRNGAPARPPLEPSGLPPSEQPRGSLPDSMDISRQLPGEMVQSSGDVIHTVRFAGETLRIIAFWFTGTADNAGRLARINGISNPDLLQMGQQVRVPRYLLRTTAPLPEEEIERYLGRSGYR